MSDLRSKQRDLLAAGLLQANRPESSTTRTVHTHQKDRNELSLPSSTDGVPQGSETWKDRRKLTYAHELPIHTGVCRLINDAQTGMLPGYPESAICVQRFDDSLNSAIHTTYRNWLRSSSMHEPRDPPLEVVMCFNLSNYIFPHKGERHRVTFNWNNSVLKKHKEADMRGRSSLS